MKFDDLDRSMRRFEQSLDQTILPELYLAARLDGRGFTRLTKEVMRFEAPFDERFRDGMADTVRQLMSCGFRVVYGYTQSDEISLLFHPAEQAFDRKVRKYNSILAGEASAALSLKLGCAAVFDCRLIPLPNMERVKDYFLWRQEDAHRNALNAHCYWMLRKEGLSAKDAAAHLENRSISYKNELLFSRGVNFNRFPAWQKRGIGLYWEKYEKTGVNPVTEKNETAVRRRLKTDTKLPIRSDYAQMIEGMLTQAQQQSKDSDSTSNK